MTQVGLMVEGQEGLTWDRWLRLGDLAEELGLASLHRSDHLSGIEGDTGRRVLSLWLSLALLASRTGTVRFGPLVSPMTWHHPALFAMQAADVGELSGGRLDVGMGAGWFEAEHRLLGLPFPRYPERLQALEHAAVLLRSSWPGRGPHLLMGGKGPRPLQVVARHADEWNCSYVGVEDFAARSAALDQACATHGRPPHAVALGDGALRHRLRRGSGAAADRRSAAHLRHPAARPARLARGRLRGRATGAGPRSAQGVRVSRGEPVRAAAQRPGRRGEPAPAGRSGRTGAGRRLSCGRRRDGSCAT